MTARMSRQFGAVFVALALALPLLAAAATTFVAPDDPAIVYSPLTWAVSHAGAETINSGSYFRALFSGRSAVLLFNISTMVSPPSQIWWRVDNGPATQADVAAAVPLNIPPITSGNADTPYHALEVTVKSTTERANRWLRPGNSTGVVFCGLVLDAGAAALASLPAPRSIIVYGDSITEGVRTLGEASPYDTDDNDAAMGWAYRLGGLLGAEVGVIGFGATGLSRGGSGNVPPTGASFGWYFAGSPRGFTPAPDLIVLNIGTNDGGTDTVAAGTALLNALLAACPAAPIGVLRPFNGAQAANLLAAIAGCAAPARVHYVDTTGFFDVSVGADSMKLHPSGANDVGRIAPQVAAALRPLLH